MSKFNLKNLDQKEGLKMKDVLRDGLSSDLDPLLVAALLQRIVDQVNNMLDRLEDLEVLSVDEKEKFIKTNPLKEELVADREIKKRGRKPNK